MKIADIDALGQGEFTALLGALFEHSPWVAERTWHRRPFASIDRLHRGMMNTVESAAQDEQLALVRAHPELAGAQAKEGGLTPASSSEQARLGLTSLSREEALRIDELNRRYRSRFGFPCIVALARHASRASVLADMERRLENPPAAELEVALREIGHITRARLEKLIAQR